MNPRTPDHWETVQLSAIADVRLGRQRSPQQMMGEHLRPYLRAANVTWQGLDISDVNRMNFTPAEFATYRLVPGDVLLSEASGSASEVGKPAVWRDEIPGCCFQNTLIRVRSRGPLPEFLYYHFLSDARQGRFADAGKGVGINHLGAERMSSWPTAVAPLGEQRRIVDKLEALMAHSRRAKDALDAIPSLLDQLRQSILAAAFRGDLTKDWRATNPDVEPAEDLLKRIRIERRRRWEEAELAKLRAKRKAPTNEKWKARYKEPAPVNDTGLPELPEGWCWASVGEVAPLQPGFAFPSAGFRGDGVRLLKGANVRDGWVSLDEVAHWNAEDTDAYAPFRLSAGDIVLAMDRPVYSSGSRATKVARLDASWEGSLLLQRVGRFQTVPSVRSDYLLLFLQSYRFREHLIREQNGTQDGKDLPHVSAAVVDSAFLPVPPYREQAVLDARVARALAVLRKLEVSFKNASELLPQLERSSLAQALRGELVPRDPSDEPASAMIARIRAESTAAIKPRRRKA